MSANLKFLIGGLVLVNLVACSSMPRTKWTDKSMRVMVDPDSVDEENFVQIQKSLVRSGKFTVVDRGRGMHAVQKEQERTHVIQGDRFADREKWSHWGKMYGVGSIVVAHVECRKDNVPFNRTKLFLECRQLLSMVDSNTGEVLLAVEGHNDGPASYDLNYIVPDWNDTVEKLVDEYPSHFKKDNYAGAVLDYQDISEENAKRKKESDERMKQQTIEMNQMREKIKELENKLVSQGE